MKSQFSIGFIFLITFYSCTNYSKKAESLVPILDSSSSFIEISAPDTIQPGTEYCAKIWLTTTEQKLVHAYANCDFENSLVLLNEGTLDNCRIKLTDENDTVYYCLKPMKTDTSYHYRIALLTIDSNKKYHLNLANLNFVTRK